MKKLVSILLILSLLVLSVTACGKKDSEQTSASPEGTLSEIIDKIYEKKDTTLALQTSSVDITDADQLKYYTGLTDATKIKEAAVSEAMITSQAYSMVLVRVKDVKDTQSVAEAMMNGIDQRKWICVEADDLKVATCGDTIMLIMVQSTLSDTVTVDQIVDAFKTVCGGKLDITLKKD